MPRGTIAAYFWTVLTLCLGGGGTALAASCDPPSGPAPGVGLGLVYQIQMPNHLPNFETIVPGYGASFNIPWGPGEVVVQSIYGTDAAVTMFLSEVGYRWHLPNPFFFFYFYGGASHLHYSPKSANARNLLGAQFGPGVYLSLGDTLDVHLGLKGFLLERFMLSLASGLTMRF